PIVTPFPYTTLFRSDLLFDFPDAFKSIVRQGPEQQDDEDAISDQYAFKGHGSIYQPEAEQGKDEHVPERGRKIAVEDRLRNPARDRKSTRLNSSHVK